MASELVFFSLLLALATQRIVEVRKSRRNVAWLRAQAAREHASGHFRVMQLVHASWLLAMAFEVGWLDAPFVPKLAAVALVGVALGQGLRYAAMAALGRRWTVRILTLPGQPAVTSGVYRYLRHPNYLGVVLEIACFPLLHGAWRTAVVWSLGNAVLLVWRIREEERALMRDNDYRHLLGAKPRLVPRVLDARGKS